LKGAKRSVSCICYLAALLLFGGCKETSLRQPGICLSFDDRSVSEWYALRPLLNKYNAKVTFFITQFDSLSSSEIRLLKELKMDGHEIGSHGAMHVLSENYIKEHSYNDYLKNEIDRNIIQMEKAGFHPTSFAYPFGAKYWFTDYLLLKRFKVLRGDVALQDDILSMDNIYCDFTNDKSLFAVSIDVNSGLNREAASKAMKRAMMRREAILFYGHVPGARSSVKGYQFDVEFLEYILMEANQHHLKFFKVSELIE
jgi:peptidoglycan/xylan/chitin deacetylase (PgdA/CDA1 family)